MDKDSRSVLGTGIISLTIFRGWIVKHEEIFNEFFKIICSIFQFYIQYLNMTSRSSAYL